MRRSPSNPRRGLAATEFAVCLPVLALLLLGTIECTSMIFLKQALSVAAYESAHTALVPGATAADARRAGDEVLAARNVRSASIEVLPGDLDAVPEGEFFQVRVSAPTGDNRVLPLRFFGGQTLSATATFLKEN